MALHAPQRTALTATVTLWVPRGAAGDLQSGAESVLSKLEAVEAVDDLRVTGFRPTATDIRVDLVADLQMRATDRADATHRLEDGFGVLAACVGPP